MKSWLLIAALTLVGCKSSEASPGSGSSGNLDDTFAPAPPPSGTDAAVFIRARVDGGTLVAEIVTRATPALSGVALRLSFPSGLSLDRREPDSGWIAQSVHHTKVEQQEVVLADVRKGKGVAHAAPPANGETVLTTLYFTRSAATPAAAASLQFITARSELRDENGKIVPVRFYDQALGR